MTNCATEPQLQEPIKDPTRFPWHEVSKVQHYWLEADGMTKLMQVREDRAAYRGTDQLEEEKGHE